ncbi:Na+/H+ antiporter NhaA [Agromyces laixinhei]|uniref:Na+/H+ antiporter NhaA n=1 Tax=Agromyces laixinhei TaxID=2585717 RepID=UPI0012EE0303|nr:Na+/H+ antiporter NhaA [Agromyces laixinhei]
MMAGRSRRLDELRARLSGGVGAAALLLLATVIALIWVNSPFGDSYEAFWHTELGMSVGDIQFSLTLQHWVNDGLMTFFFLIVGFEVKQELVLGELADPRRAAVPAIAALVGLAVPALVYVTFNLSGGEVGAWGVVISTDTAFVIGILALLGTAVPPQLRIFLLAVAIGDDVGALTVIAVFYTEDFNLLAFAVAGAGLLAMFGLRRLRVWRGPAYLVVGTVSWVALYLSGVHPTLLGVAVALITPAYLPRRGEVEAAVLRTRMYAQSPNAGYARAARLSIERSTPPGPRLSELWQPWVSFVFVPLFALANAGVPLSGETLAASLTSPITLGVVAGLVVGKLVGISLGTWLAVVLRLGTLAPGIDRLHVIGGAALSGIGFTISLFIIDLAFTDDRLANQARVGVLTASVIAGVLGSVLFRIAARRSPVDAGPPLLNPPVDAERDHIRGPVDAPLTLVGFGDFQASYRGWGVIEELQELLGDRFRYVYRHAPQSAEHPQAQLAAEAAEAAAAQGRFWEMHDRLYARQDQLNAPDMVVHARAIGLDVPRFTRDLGSGRFARHVRHDVESAEASGVTGFPAFYIGGRLHAGPHDARTLAAELLAADGATETQQRDVTASLSAVDDRRSAAVAEWNLADLLDDLPPDLPETLDSGGDQPRPTDDQLDRLARLGRQRAVSRGDILYRPGDAGYDFTVVTAGAVAVVGRPAGQEQVIRVHGPRRFLGAFDLFERTTVERAAVVIRDGSVLQLTVEQLLDVLVADAALSELVQRAFLVRQAIGLEHFADVRIVGHTDDPHARRLREWADANGLSSVLIDLDSDDAAEAHMTKLGLVEADLPVVVFARGGVVLRNPDETQLRGALQVT